LFLAARRCSLILAERLFILTESQANVPKTRTPKKKATRIKKRDLGQETFPAAATISKVKRAIELGKVSIQARMTRRDCFGVSTSSPLKGKRMRRLSL
jgi:uncharacterized protein YerC